MRSFVFVVDDPGIPEGSGLDPFAGLDAETVRLLREEIEGVALPPDALAVPLVTQETGWSCGPAVALAVLRFWHKAGDLSEVELARLSRSTPRTGTEADDLALVLKMRGLDARYEEGLGYSDLRRALSRGAAPILALQAYGGDGGCDSGHYAVLIAMDEERAYFMDPMQSGRYGYIALDDLASRWRESDAAGRCHERSAVIAYGRVSHPGPLGRVALGHIPEAKAIGTGKLGGDVHARDAALRQVPTTQVRTNVRLGGINVARDLGPVESEARASIGLLLRMWLGGAMTEDRMLLQTSKRWREAFERVREIGRRASGLDRLPVSSEILREEEEWFRSYVREELRLWHVFMEEIREGRVGGVEEFREGRTKGRLYQRFESYLSALRALYESSRVYALPRDVLVYWMGPKRDDPEICEGCVYLMERSPFPKDKLPCVPKDGTTECLTNCRHRIVLRVARALNEVQRRRDALPGRAEMVRDLEKIKEAKHGTHRQARGREIARGLARPHSVNPFVGQPLPPRRG